MGRQEENMQYTNQMYEKLWDIRTDFEDNGPEKLKKFLNDSNNFRNFGEALSELILKVMPEKCDLSTKDFLKYRAREKEIPLARNTVNNWFEGVRPKKGEASREHMYRIAFALELSIEETIELFTKVYFDRPFNMRRPDEIVYYYCLKNKYDYQRACLILSKINFEPGNNEDTVLTQMISNDVKQLYEDEEIIKYISNLSHNLSLNNVSGKKILRQLISEIKGNQEDLDILKKGYISSSDNASLIIREIEIDESLFGKDKSNNKSKLSTSTMLDVIMGVSLVKVREEKGFLFKNVNLPQEIKNRFPEKNTFSKEEPTYEELRKMIILLFSYRFWFGIQYDYSEDEFDDYEAQLNDILHEAGMQTLYYGNPFDWLFLYCTSEGGERPLDLFRNLVQEFMIE